MGDDGRSGADGYVSVDETALASFVEVSGRLAGELAVRLAEVVDLDRRVRNASPDAEVPVGVLDEVGALVARWQGSAGSADGVRHAVTGADQACPAPWRAGATTGVPGLPAWAGSGPAGRNLGDPMSVPDDDEAGRLVEIFPVMPDLGLGIETLPPAPDLGLEIETLPPSPDLGLEIETLPPSPDLCTEIEIFPVGDEERILREHASRQRRAAKPAAEQPVPSGPVFRPAGPSTPVPVNGKLYPAHQVTFWPTGRTAPGPDGKPLPLYDTRLLGDGATHIDNNTLVNTDNKRIWHLDVENPDPGGRPGQFHLQYKIKGQTFRHMYDFNTDQFLPSKDGTPLPRWLDKEVRNLADFAQVVSYARRSLNVPPAELP